MGELLPMTLAVAVPLHIEQIVREQWCWNDILREAADAGAYIAAHGDDVLYRGVKAGATAKAFNKLARGIACLAFATGGVTVFGLHFEADASRLRQQ